jgi:uncharacterized membrane protein
MNRFLRYLSPLIVLALFLTGWYFYGALPEQVASHWNSTGQVNGMMPRTAGVLFLPALALVLYVVFLVIPLIDPLKANIALFRAYYDFFIFLLLLFFLYVHLLTMLWNTGARFNMTVSLAPGFGMLIYSCGIILGKAKRNWFVGIRTPWTLSSDVVWDKTHKLGGILFRVCGVISALGVFAGRYAFYLLIAPLIAVSLYLVLYSYLEYKGGGQ